MREFPMSLSVGLKVLSAVVTLLVASIPLLVWSAVPGIRLPAGGAFAANLVLFAPLVPLLSWAWSPRAVALEGGEIRILRRAWRAAAYPIQEVSEVAVLPPRWLLGAVRTFGNGGLFGYYGWFWKKGGAFRLFATRRDRLVEIVVGGKRVVVSPDEPRRLAEAILASAPRARPGQGDAAGAASASRTS
jgi:hypothetical protein